MTWEPKHALIGLALLVAPTLIVILIAMVRGYNVMLWRRNDSDDPVFYFGRRRLQEEHERDDDD